MDSPTNCWLTVTFYSNSASTSSWSMTSKARSHSKSVSFYLKHRSIRVHFVPIIVRSQVWPFTKKVLHFIFNFRANVFEKDGVSLSPNHEGTHWVRIEQPRDAKIIFKQVECTEDNIWAVDKDNTIWYKEFSNVDQHLNRNSLFQQY